ncbi:SRPBCC domain-containing protein [Spirosoma koreense]
MTELIVRNRISLDSPVASVWDALTNPEQTQKYMFGCKALSDWTVGSPLLWTGSWEGQDMVFVKGTITAITPEAFLAYTTFDPNSALEDIPENYVTVTYTLTPQGNQTILDVTQGDFATVADGEKRYTETYNNGEGWNPILVEIKKLVENP